MNDEDLMAEVLRRNQAKAAGACLYFSCYCMTEYLTNLMIFIDNFV